MVLPCCRAPWWGRASGVGSGQLLWAVREVGVGGGGAILCGRHGGDRGQAGTGDQHGDGRRQGHKLRVGQAALVEETLDALSVPETGPIEGKALFGDDRPLELEIGPDAEITTDPRLTTEKDAGETIPGEIEEIKVFIRYDNEFEFGIAVTVLMDSIRAHFDDGTADVLVDSLLIYAGETGLDSLVLNDERLGLFNQDSMYVQAKINVLGQTDENGNPVPSKFLSTDTLQLNIYGRIQYLIDGPELARDDE